MRGSKFDGLQISARTQYTKNISEDLASSIVLFVVCCEAFLVQVEQQNFFRSKSQVQLAISDAHARLPDLLDSLLFVKMLVRFLSAKTAGLKNVGLSRKAGIASRSSSPQGSPQGSPNDVSDGCEQALNLPLKTWIGDLKIRTDQKNPLFVMLESVSLNVDGIGNKRVFSQGSRNVY